MIDQLPEPSHPLLKFRQDTPIQYDSMEKGHARIIVRDRKRLVTDIAGGELQAIELFDINKIRPERSVSYLRNIWLPSLSLFLIKNHFSEQS